MPVSCRHAERQQERQTEPPERYETDSMTTIRSDLWNVIRPSYTAPEDYISKTLRPLRRYTEPNADAHLLRQCRATVTKLDFASGQPVDEDRPTLLRLLKTRRLERDIGRIKPWMQYDGFTDDYEPDLDSCLSEPRACLRNGGLLAKVLSVNIDGASGDGRGSLLDGTAWAVESESRTWDATCKYRHNHDTCELRGTYYQVESILSRGLPSCLRSRPHVICHVADSTPFEEGIIRTGEFKAVAFFAWRGNSRWEYNHLDSFGVTVVSFWDTDVRIVQGLVNLKTRDMDIRVSPVQSFRDGIRREDGTLDPRFLTLMAYNLADVVPLPR